jgi:hypothetical protein
MFGSRRSDAIRSRVTLDEIEGLQIVIPPAKNGFPTRFLAFWLVGWAIGEIVVAGWLVGLSLGVVAPPHMKNDNIAPVPFLLLWLAGWTVGGVYAIDLFVWRSRGREWVRIDPAGESLVLRRLGTFIPRRTRTHPLDRVRNLRYAPLTMPLFPTSFREALESQLQMVGTGGGSVAFDVDGRTERFGSQLSETESRRLIKTIKDHYKIQDDKDEALPVERL